MFYKIWLQPGVGIVENVAATQKKILAGTHRYPKIIEF